MHPDSAPVISTRFAFGVQGKGVKIRALSDYLFLFPPATYSELQIVTGTTKADNHLKQGIKSNEMCTYKRDVVGYVHVLCIYK